MTACCQTLLSLLGIGLAERLRATGHFRLPSAAASAACLDGLAELISAAPAGLRGSSLVPGCFRDPDQFAITPTYCAGVSTAAEFEAAVGNDSVQALNSSCGPDLASPATCTGCYAAGVAATAHLTTAAANNSKSGSADRLSIVAFSGAAKRLLPLRRMTRQGQRSARQIVDRLVVCAAAATAAQGQGQQSACVGDALRKATKVLEDRRDRNPVATVMLLSDTQQQQHGDHSTTRKQGFGRPAVAPATRFTHVEIPIGDAPPPLVASDEEEEQEAPVEHAFAKCLGGLVSVVMQEVHLELVFPAEEITAVYSCGPGQQAVALSTGGGGGVSVRLGEMYAEEERELLVELRAPLAGARRNKSEADRWGPHGNRVLG